MSISEPKITQVAIDHIEADIDKRLRPVSLAGVDSLIQSIEQLGVMKDPIHLRRKGRGESATLVLMAGAHRLAAAQQLGWDTIPARVWADVSNDFAMLMEIDDNLSGADLSNLELAVFLANRKKVYERMYPQAKHATGAKLAAKRWGRNTVDIMSFAQSVAQKRALSPRHINRFVSIGQRLSAPQIKTLGALEQPPSLKELMALAKISDDQQRSDVIALLGDGVAENLSDAIEQCSDDSPVVNLNDADFAKLVTAWNRASAKSKRRFVSDYGPDIVAMVAKQPKLKAIS